MIWALVGSERLFGKGRKALNAGPLVLSAGGEILSIRTAHISVIAGLPDIHKDAFDRMLIAQASAEGLTVITSDEQFSQYPVKVLW